MGTRSGFWAAEAAFHFQLRHPSACLKLQPYHHRTAGVVLIWVANELLQFFAKAFVFSENPLGVTQQSL
jgi:hypothetical protein